MAKNIDKGEVLVYTIGLVRKSVTKENEMKSCCILLWTLLLILCLVGSPVFAEGILDTEVTCTFTNKDLAEIVANLQTQAKIDIALDPAISQSKISLDLGKTTLGTVLDQIILKTGAFYRQVGEKSLIIASLNPKGIYFADISETEIVLIKFSLVEQVMALLANNSLLQYAVADKASNQISITAPRPIINRLKAEIAKIDVEPLSMSFELSVLDTTKSELKDAGFQLALTNAKPNSNGVSTFTFQNTIVGFTNPYAALQLFHYFAGNNVKILNQPKGIVDSGQTLELSFGEDLTVLTVIVGGVGVPGGLNTVKSGTQITIKPRVISPNKIKTEIKGDISQPVAAFSSGNIVTRTTHRTFQTTRFLTDGETAFIGGLANKAENITKSKFPILGDIPLIGTIFRSSHKEFLNQEITILVTLRLIKKGVISPETEKIIEESKEKVEERKPILEGEKTPSITTPSDK